MLSARWPRLETILKMRWRKLQESDPVRSEIYRELGRTCHSLGDSQRALQYLLKA